MLLYLCLTLQFYGFRTRCGFDGSWSLTFCAKVCIQITDRYYRCHWIDSLCICWLSISLEHGFFQKASIDPAKPLPPQAKHWFPRRWTRPSNLLKEVIFCYFRPFLGYIDTPLELTVTSLRMKRIEHEVYIIYFSAKSKYTNISF
ncbi:uncharacterized protein LOC111795764 isoform X2 [Cucurbita pepo subsp. pepo]|uniref:uncharacterized protein LOC111795764 isoform X2 n=1 Tax=Cucurbita pepo subsp. pepo TaxID=3664 RepID=UPI000C9D9220|nr:uncharacterized protein LOC111795764 isoform X2 [Cucurbita pepo subsp. pepo]